MSRSTLAAMVVVLGGCAAVGERSTGSENEPLTSGAACRRTGCSGQLCSDSDRPSTCEWRDEYACYQQATCERQPDGACGFTPSAALSDCLDAGSPPPVAPCYRGGCSGQLCSDREGLVSTCEWRDEYACYQQASCERQPDGACGFTPSAALTDCLSGR